MVRNKREKGFDEILKAHRQATNGKIVKFVGQRDSSGVDGPLRSWSWEDWRAEYGPLLAYCGAALL